MVASSSSGLMPIRAVYLQAGELDLEQERSDLAPRRNNVVGYCTMVGLLGSAVLAVVGLQHPQQVAMSLRAGAAELAEKVTVSRSMLKVDKLESDACEIEDSIYLPGNDIENVSDVDSPDTCCSICRDHPKCLAWSWGKAWDEPMSSVCFLKGAFPRALTKVAAADFVSGQTHQKDKEGAPLEAKRPAQGQSLFCLSLLQAQGYERQLVLMQFQERASIFACDEYAVYSNTRFEVAPNLWTGFVNSSLKCDMGGEFGTALNTGIFLALWANIVFDGRFVYHDWTVKADPDSVFLPDRLRLHLMNHFEEARGVYINNCKFGFHGPLEVFSRNAVKAWALGATSCVRHFTDLCSGPCGWGEDMFIDQCLHRKLNVRRASDFRLLLEDHCDPPENWQECTNHTVASFHPFKTQEAWKTCLENTRQAAKAHASDATGMTFKKLQ